MADCIPTGGEAAVISRKQQASGFGFPEAGIDLWVSNVTESPEPEIVA
jgi:hypothetical protein